MSFTVRESAGMVLKTATSLPELLIGMFSSIGSYCFGYHFVRFVGMKRVKLNVSSNGMGRTFYNLLFREKRKQSVLEKYSPFTCTNSYALHVKLVCKVGLQWIS